MAKTGAVWGIDLGSCALKALRCRPHEKDDNKIVVEAFDYIEYPKILTQPEANREELIKEAFDQFISRNQLDGDRVAISVPGQSGLARFIKLPPVEAKKIPDIVKYEARQQIPFALEDVVWDYQALAGGSIDEGYALETEVGLFAMKRDQVARALKPFDDAGIEVDIIQLAPLAIYNFVCFDQLGNLEAYQRDNPPPSKVVLSLGTDTTDLVITDGYRVWQRSIPIGGNHFTKALTKELKLTFAKAEHLKRNAMKAENPKAVFQAMRPVFSDLVAEIQRSIGFFTSNNRNAKLGSVIALGNPMKLPGLQRFLAQNLDQDVTPIEQFNGLIGGSVTAVPNFKENQLTFGVAYGLCVQALRKSQLNTNLLPKEIITSRLVRAKKPWAVAAAALLMTGMAFSYASHYWAWQSAAVDSDSNPAMASALSKAASSASQAATFVSTQSDLVSKITAEVDRGKALVSNVEGRLLWLELLKAIDTALPKDPRPMSERKQTAEDVTSRPELHIISMDCQHFPDISPWATSVQNAFEASRNSYSRLSAKEKAAVEAAAAAAAAAAEASPAEGDVVDPAMEPPIDEVPVDPAMGGEMAADGTVAPTGPAPPTGEGWVIQLKGYHYRNTMPGNKDLDFRNNEGKLFVDNTLVKQLEEGSVQLPDGPNGEMVEVPMEKLGIKYPVVTKSSTIYDVPFAPEATSSEGGAPSMGRGPRMGAPGMAGEAGVEGPKIWKLRRSDFTVQFFWKPTPRSERVEKPAGEGTSEFDTAYNDGTGPTG
jgi:type IV pilus assembly protein PilM